MKVCFVASDHYSGPEVQNKHCFHLLNVDLDLKKQKQMPTWNSWIKSTSLPVMV